MNDPSELVNLGSELVNLGSAGFPVPRLAMGTAPLASIFWGNDAGTAIATATRALQRGIGFFDTAPFYGLGEAESRLGSALAARNAEPEKPAVIATKVGRLLAVDERGQPVDAYFDFSYDAALRSLESSLERLGVGAVDIVHVHDPDDYIDEALEGSLRALVRLRDEGVIRAVSVGTNTVATAQAFLERAGIDCMLVAGRYTLLDSSAAGLIDSCANRGVAYLAAGVFNSGVLADPRPGAWYDYGPVTAELLQRAVTISEICERFGVGLREAAVNFALTNPAVTAVVVGMAAPSEVDENLAALRKGVPQDLWGELRSARLLSP